MNTQKLTRLLESLQPAVEQKWDAAYKAKITYGLRDAIALLASPEPSQPDPSWDYYQLWGKLLSMKIALDNVLTTVTNAEDASDDIDDILIGSLEALRGDALTALDSIPKWQKLK